MCIVSSFYYEKLKFVKDSDLLQIILLRAWKLNFILFGSKSKLFSYTVTCAQVMCVYLWAWKGGIQRGVQPFKTECTPLKFHMNSLLHLFSHFMFPLRG